ncbi:hypothetical protein [Solidesulfovibrio magneticus]|uniref:Uncharacterized protein n=1 Tax=Solidesulfovibrio magneticus (strain ATCC 700980 / DSM 13731 / RS-1) TaxID=573370 RepID=C4XNM0_SOLM1|nr:hypothetical protein [Solidesulfovibrio magneticus]BAH74995.1 hypothetical protein DMR_15040 [Solidesulfovibrio magneticus RS-1]
MRYIYVVDSAADDELGKVISKISPECLYSLIGGLKQKQFGIDTLCKEVSRINKFRSRIVIPSKGVQYMDSGGYSIIQGQVSPGSVRRFIKCYNAYVENEIDNYERVFSLDIPFSKKYSAINTVDAIYELNRESLSDLRELMVKYPDLRDKVYFVWHFKMNSQYGIWKKLYDELDLKSYIKNRAIGGMVGMREVTKKSFSPFTPMAYKCLIDFVQNNETEKEFSLHFLGMHINYDRFQIALLEKLFQNYLGDYVSVNMTYDSISYAQTARMGNSGPIYLDSNDANLWFGNVKDVPERILQSVYGDITPQILEEIRLRSCKQKLVNCNSFAPLFISSNINEDRVFERIIDKYEIAKIIVTSSSSSVVACKLRSILSEIEESYKSMFNREFLKSIAENIEATIVFDRWFRCSRDLIQLDELIKSFNSWHGFADLLK